MKAGTAAGNLDSVCPQYLATEQKNCDFQKIATLRVLHDGRYATTPINITTLRITLRYYIDGLSIT